VTYSARGTQSRAVRNGLPARPYVYRAPRPEWAVRAVAESLAQHGKPVTR